MLKRFRGEWFSIPNLFSYFRLLLIPAFIWAYCAKEQYRLAALLLIISSASDVADGFIARRFDMVTNLGKILDPVADKLTQLTTAVCLASRYHEILFMLCLMAAKEIYLAITGCLVIHKTDTVNGAAWHGKLNSALYFLIMLTLLLVPDIPQPVVRILVLIGSASMIMSMVLYTTRYMRMLKAHKQKTAKAAQITKTASV